MQGSKIAIGITGKAGATYKLYRRWEPTYARRLIGAFQATGTDLAITQDLKERDSYGGGRYRATYEITTVDNGVESLPRTIDAEGIKTVRGITATSDGKLLVAENMGQCTPVVELFDGTTPYAELINSWRFGHTVCKSVASRHRADYWYNTLIQTDMPYWPDFGLDMVEPRPISGQNVNAANYNLHGFWASDFSKSAPYTFKISDPQHRVHAGDMVDSPVKADILSRDGGVCRRASR